LMPVKKSTKDHVFPKSWYTDDTPSWVQRWTVPSCATCNGKFGALEKGLFLRLAMCIDPAKAEASGITKALLRSLGVWEGISDGEREIRKKLLKGILAETKPYRGEKPLPGLGPHQGFPPEIQRTIPIPENLLMAVLGKIFRGSEYILNNDRYVMPP